MTFSTEQTDALEAAYQANPKIEKTEAEALASQLGLNSKQVSPFLIQVDPRLVHTQAKENYPASHYPANTKETFHASHYSADARRGRTGRGGC
jgi:hypothetical protein